MHIVLVQATPASASSDTSAKTTIKPLRFRLIERTPFFFLRHFLSRRRLRGRGRRQRTQATGGRPESGSIGVNASMLARVVTFFQVRGSPSLEEPAVIEPSGAGVARVAMQARAGAEVREHGRGLAPGGPAHPEGLAVEPRLGEASPSPRHPRQLVLERCAPGAATDGRRRRGRRPPHFLPSGLAVLPVGQGRPFPVAGRSVGVQSPVLCLKGNFFPRSRRRGPGCVWMSRRPLGGHHRW
jgi:hypothetical protein